MTSLLDGGVTRASGSTLRPGDIVELELGSPVGSEACLRRPAIVITAAQILRGGPNVIHVVPLTRTIHSGRTEVLIKSDPLNGLEAPAMAQCQHIRAVATSRVHRQSGNVGRAALFQIREVLGAILDL